MSAVIQNPPSAEIQRKLQSMGCELTTTPLFHTKISFPHVKHTADYVIVGLDVIRYMLAPLLLAFLVKLLYSAYRADYLGFRFFL